MNEKKSGEGKKFQFSGKNGDKKSPSANKEQAS